MKNNLIPPAKFKRLINSVLIVSSVVLLPFIDWRANYIMPGWAIWLILVVIFLSGYLYRSTFSQYEDE